MFDVSASAVFCRSVGVSCCNYRLDSVASKAMNSLEEPSLKKLLKFFELTHYR